MARFEITCIHTTPRFDPHGRIHSVGGIGFKYTQEKAIRYIEAGVASFFVHAGGHTVEVIVSMHNGYKYLKARSDGLQPDHLLSLPECP